MSTRFELISLSEGCTKREKGCAVMNYLRAGVRIPVELPVQIKWKNRAGRPRQVEGKTAFISGNGMFVTAPVRLRGQTPVMITVVLPVDVTKVPVRLLCYGRVATGSESAGLMGIRAIIDDYQFERAHRPV